MCSAGHTVAMVIYCVTMIVAHQVIKSNYNVSSKSNKKNPFAFANKHNAFSPVLHYTTRKKRHRKRSTSWSNLETQASRFSVDNAGRFEKNNRPSPPQTNLK